jgi:hypothetical protein
MTEIRWDGFPETYLMTYPPAVKVPDQRPVPFLGPSAIIKNIKTM